MDTVNYTNEVWKTIPFAPDYMASDMGRVKRVVSNPFSRKTNAVMKTSRDKDGYEKIKLFVMQKAVHTKVHTCVCAAFHGPKPSPTHQVAHGDGHKTNNSADNLRWATPKENGQDAAKHGSLRGERNPAAKITRCDAEAMRLMRFFGVTTRQLIERFGVRESQVLRILNYQSWA